jgi:hypothetical protein
MESGIFGLKKMNAIHRLDACPALPKANMTIGLISGPGRNVK